MAANYEEAADESSSELSDTDFESQSESSSDPEQPPAPRQNVCKYYNDGNCRYGKKCRDLHVCKYFLKGSCRYGADCRLKHDRNSNRSSGHRDQGATSHGRRSRGNRHCSSNSASSDSEDESGSSYQWQLDLGKGWKNVANDHILEAQYSRPNTKGIKIYNTPCGALSIDFSKMRILKKTNLRVRRKGSRQTEWLWYYQGNHGWYQYGDKDSKGNSSSVSSSQLEKEYQKNPRGTAQFSVGSTNYQIRFKDMSQKNLSTDHKRRIRRRPKYESQKNGGGMSSVTKGMKKLSASSPKKTPVWQYGGQNEHWHQYKHRDGCSVSSADIEAEYQRNRQGSINFTVNGTQYEIDFSNMTQTNLKTLGTRQVQRIKK